MNEMLRIYSPAPTSFLRKATEKHKIIDLDVPIGVSVLGGFNFSMNNP